MLITFNTFSRLEQMSEQNCAIAYVHLGTELPPTLEEFSKSPRNFQGKIHKVLITDEERSMLQFDGKVVVHDELSRAGKALLEERPFYSRVASGYWLNTYERLFALRAIADLRELTPMPIVHLESDVLPIFNSVDIEFLCNNFKKVAIPRFSEDRGIGSFMFAPNLGILLDTLDELEELTIKNRDWIENDMELLGLALNNGILEELPSHPSDYEKAAYNLVDNERVLFDGAAFGQYLFGQDPFHQAGMRYSGYENPSYVLRTKIDSMLWKLESNQSESTLIVEFENIRYRIANIHVHSKEIIPPISAGDVRWQRAIDEANGNIARKREPSTVSSPHTNKLGLAVRLQIARKKGLSRTLFNYVKKRLSWGP